MGGGLYDPLGAGPAASVPRWRPSFAVVTIGTVSAAVVILVVAVALRGGDERGEPRATAPIERVSLPAPPPAVASPPPPVAAITAPASAPAQPAASAPPALPAVPGDADVEIQNGVRIVRMRPQPPKPASQAATLPAAPATPPKSPLPVPASGTR